MTDRSIVLIDAGYLLAAAATLITGSQYRRGINVNHDQLLQGIRTFAQDDSHMPVRRIIWYDAAHGGQPDEVHRRIGRLDATKIRIGRIGVSGEQKGVDVRLVLDMIDLAASGRIDTIYLISGDDDLTAAVDRAQEQGVEVVVLGVPTATGEGVMAVAEALTITADRTLALPSELLQRNILKVTQQPPVPTPGPVVRPQPQPTAQASVPRPTPVPAPPPGPLRPAAHLTTAAASQDPVRDPYWVRTRIDAVVDRLIATVSESTTADELSRIHSRRPSIPAELDRVLLNDAAAELGIDDLPDAIRFDLREAFWQAMDEHHLPPTPAHR